MPGLEIRACTTEDLEAFALAASSAFGWEITPSGRERLFRLLEPGRLLCAVEDGAIVGTAGAFPFDLTVPGGTVPAAGVTLVGVVPSHRRRGILTEMMRRQLSDVGAWREPVAILWATEGNIYPRFGYGLASLAGAIDIERDRAIFRERGEPAGRTRLVALQDAARLLPPVYDRARAVTPGMVSRTDAWWVSRRLFDDKDSRGGGGPLFCSVWEIEGRPEAYALYRLHRAWEQHIPAGWLNVLEVLGTSHLATREIWRYLFGIDLVRQVKADLLPLDHPLVFMVAEPRRLRMTVGDALWLRIVDLPAALRARSYAVSDALILEVKDTFCPSQSGRWRLDAGPGGADVQPTEDEPDLSLDIQDLGAAYLGGISVTQLVAAGQIVERSKGAAGRADRLFRGDRSPWCVEIF